VLNVDDYLARATFPDEIGRYNYGVDIHAGKATPEAYAKFHEEHKGATFRYNAGETYGIPYRILLPKGLENVYVAGRCVSTDRHVQSSIRVMPGCYITGQAAGVAAALAAAADGGTRGVDVGEVQRRLVALGGYLPNCGG
jgi:hypothetical protein